MRGMECSAVVRPVKMLGLSHLISPIYLYFLATRLAKNHCKYFKCMYCFFYNIILHNLSSPIIWKNQSSFDFNSYFKNRLKNCLLQPFPIFCFYSRSTALDIVFEHDYYKRSYGYLCMYPK